MEQFVMSHPGYALGIIAVIGYVITEVADSIAVMVRGHKPDDGFWTSKDQQK